jgi:N-acetyl-1-D-myo-inositol-2-amino-2-deoxy-alpha-D-glucopyranoside deacetylase
MTRTLLGIFAHPDDEGSSGGALAKYAALGDRVCVACATRGDGVDAKISNAALATRETLGQVRSAELTCACARLGLEAPFFLGFQDGEVDQVPVEAGGRAVARLIRAVQPKVIITHGPEGGYGHPDHIAVSGLVTRGFALAGDPASEVEGPPFAPAKLYYTAMPRSFMEQVPAFRDRRADIRGQQLGFVGVADEAITTIIPIAEFMDLKLEALSCHRTQFEIDPETGRPKFFATSVPEPQRSQMFGYERFVLAQSEAPRNGLEDDLFAGLGQL